jgi:hypothetical protein
MSDNVDVNNVQLVIANGFPFWIADDELRTLWQKFHRERARLQLVTAEANIKKH